MALNVQRFHCYQIQAESCTVVTCRWASDPLVRHWNFLIFFFSNFFKFFQIFSNFFFFEFFKLDSNLTSKSINFPRPLVSVFFSFVSFIWYPLGSFSPFFLPFFLFDSFIYYYSYYLIIIELINLMSQLIFSN